MESRLVQKLPLTMGIKDWMDEWEGVYESSLVQVPNFGGFTVSRWTMMVCVPCMTASSDLLGRRGLIG